MGECASGNTHLSQSLINDSSCGSLCVLRNPPDQDRFFVLGGQSEGHYYADWFNDDGKRYDAGVGEYMTDLIANRSIDWMREQITENRSFFAYIAPHAPHTRATPAPGSDGYFWDWQAPRLPS